MNKTIELERKVAALIKRAKEEGKKMDIKSSSHSSLHKIIKTKEQADLFMKHLKEA
jgi:hypothetical protein